MMQQPRLTHRRSRAAGSPIRRRPLIFGFAAMLLMTVPPARGDDTKLPVIGPAPSFALTAQDGTVVTLDQLRGKVVALTFIYTGCPDVCPLLTEKMAQVQGELGADFGAKIFFVSITLDPERDTPQVLHE